jgi:hypothetical protein
MVVSQLRRDVRARWGVWTQGQSRTVTPQATACMRHIGNLCARTLTHHDHKLMTSSERPPDASLAHCRPQLPTTDRCTIPAMEESSSAQSKEETDAPEWPPHAAESGVRRSQTETLASAAAAHPVVRRSQSAPAPASKACQAAMWRFSQVFGDETGEEIADGASHPNMHAESMVLSPFCLSNALQYPATLLP